MKRFSFITLAGLAVAIGLAPHGSAFQSVTKVSISAQAITSGFTALTITAEPLPAQAFFGKNVLIPIEVSSDPAPLYTQNLSLEIVYQILDANGKALGPMSGVPIRTILSPTKRNTLKGVAIIPRSNLTGIRRGGFLHYFFRARQNGGDTILARPGLSRAPSGSPESAAPSEPFEVAIIDTLRVPVGPQGSLVRVPDLFVNDGRTAVNFGAGALSNRGTLVIRQEDVNGWPDGPRGLQPVEVYSFNLEDTSLLRSAELTFSYPAETTGRVIDSNADPLDLAPYWLDASQWRILSKPRIDTTLHTVTAITTHFSTFALFASGRVSGADLRPADRIITPNGDGVNDAARFGIGMDEVRIFDMRGRRVRSIPGPGPVWDGKDDDGQIVESGVYLYQFTVEGDRVSGVIAVAK